MQPDLGDERDQHKMAGAPGIPDVTQAAQRNSPPICWCVGQTTHRCVWRVVSVISRQSVFVYRGNTLIGAVGVSGDGDRSDDMVAFMGPHNAGQALKRRTTNCSSNRYGLTTSLPQGIRLRYVTAAPPIDTIDNVEEST